MSIPQSDNIQLNAPKQLDNRTGVVTGSTWRPFNDVAEFNASWPLLVRFPTQSFWVLNPIDSNKADLYALRNDKTPYKVLSDVDLSAYYTSTQVDSITFAKTTTTAIRALTGTLKNNYFSTTDILGDWYYDASDTTSADNLGLVLVTADGKRIKRFVTDFYNVIWFGASPLLSASANNTIITAAFTSVNNIGTFVIPKGVLTDDTTLVFPNQITVLDFQRNCMITNKLQIGGAKASGGAGALIWEVRGAQPNSRASEYVMPRGIPSGTVPAAVKIFFDDFEAEMAKLLLDPTYLLQYRDIGVYADTSFGCTGAGTGFYNVKSQGNWFGVYPEAAFCIQDGNVIPLRNIYHDYTIPHLKVNGAWSANTPVTVGQIFIAFGIYYECTVAGTTGTVRPSHTTGSQVDGTVTWLYRQQVAGGGAGFQGLVIIGSNANPPVKYIPELCFQLENHASLKNGKALHFLKNDDSSAGYFEAGLNTNDVFFRFSRAILTFGAITAGSGYVNGTYNNIPLSGGTGKGATANITISGGVVTAVTKVRGGFGYTVSDSLSIPAALTGGTGSGASVLVATISSLGNFRFGENGFVQLNNISILQQNLAKANLATTMAVNTGNTVSFSDNAPTNFTSITGLPGQTILLNFSTAQTTLVHSANLALAGGVNFTPAAGQIMQFYSSTGTAWVEVGQRTVIVKDATAVAYTKATINAAYPNAKVNFTVSCITLGATYVKIDNSLNGDWDTYASVRLT